MKVAVTGSSGLIGSALVERLQREGHQVTRVVRHADPAPGEITWDPQRGRIDAVGLEGHDAIVHLAGESLMGVWTREKMARIRESRVAGTRLLAGAIAGLQRKPAVLVSGSALGYYGNRPFSEPVDETAPRGTGFLAETAELWEQAAEPAARAGVRVAYARTSLVLSRRGGMLEVVLPIFRLGLGGQLGDGTQPWSWITLEDEVRAILHIIAHNELRGPVNLAAPGAVTNAEFTHALASALHRPALFKVPAFALRLVNEEFANDMMLGGVRMVPNKLLNSGFTFEHPDLRTALPALLES